MGRHATAPKQSFATGALTQRMLARRQPWRCWGGEGWAKPPVDGAVPQVSQCLSRIAGMGAEQVQVAYGLPSLHMAQALHNRSTGAAMMSPPAHHSLPLCRQPWLEGMGRSCSPRQRNCAPLFLLHTRSGARVGGVTSGGAHSSRMLCGPFFCCPLAAMHEHGFEYALTEGWPRNPNPWRYKFTPPCCKIKHTDTYRCAHEWKPNTAIPFGDPITGGPWRHERKDPGTYEGGSVF